jgi:large subunit ribosomal protein L13
MTKTYSPRASEITRDWHVVDADGVPLGRLASRVAQLLRGKHKPSYAPHLDSGDHVIVVNASKVSLTGGKGEQKMYYRHSGYPGGFRAIAAKAELAKRPDRVVERAIRGMLPHTTLGRQIYRKLHVYSGPEHPHAGQVARGSRQVDPAPVATGRRQSDVAPVARRDPEAAAEPSGPEDTRPAAITTQSEETTA